MFVRQKFGLRQQSETTSGFLKTKGYSMGISKLVQVLGAVTVFSSLAACHTSGYSGAYDGVYGGGYDGCDWSCSWNNGSSWGGGGGYNDGGSSGNGGGSSNNGGGWNNGGSWNNGSSNSGSNNSNGGSFNNNNGWNNGTAESGSTEEGHDLIAQVVEHSDAEVLTAGRKVADQFALSEDTGIQIARTMNSWAAVARKRSLTDADIADFSKRLYGIEIDQAKEALVKAKAGDKSGIEKASADIGKYWGTSPETVKTIFKTWYKDELKNIGLQ